jgi:hypothetical protein
LSNFSARLRIVGSTDGKPIAIAAIGIAEIRPWLSVLVKTFRLTQYTILSLSVDVPRAAAHWRVDIHSKIIGVVVPTELVELIDVRGGRISSHIEFFVPIQHFVGVLQLSSQHARPLCAVLE